MSTLSKVFVVLVLLASVVFAMTSIAFLATVDNYKNLWTKEKDLRAQAEKDRDNNKSMLDAEKTAHALTVTQKDAQIATQKTEIESLKAAKAGVDNELVNLKTTLDKVGVDLAAVKGELVKARADNDRLHKELDDQIAKAATAENLRRDHEQKMIEAVNKYKIATDDNKAKDEQVVLWMGKAETLDRARQAYKKRTGIDIMLAEGGAEQVDLIEGVVTDVRRQPNNEIWVQLSVGTANKVKEGTVFSIYSDAYKGDVRITKVFPDSSVGVLVLPGNKEVLKGDRAKTRLD